MITTKHKSNLYIKKYFNPKILLLYHILSVWLGVWLKLFFKVFFIQKYIKIIFFIFLKLFLKSSHENNLKIKKLFNLKYFFFNLFKNTLKSREKHLIVNEKMGLT